MVVHCVCVHSEKMSTEASATDTDTQTCSGGAVRSVRQKRRPTPYYRRIEDDRGYKEYDRLARNRKAVAAYRRRKQRAYKDAVDLSEELRVKCEALEVELCRVQDENLVMLFGLARSYEFEKFRSFVPRMKSCKHLCFRPQAAWKTWMLPRISRTCLLEPPRSRVPSRALDRSHTCGWPWVLWSAQPPPGSNGVCMARILHQ